MKNISKKSDGATLNRGLPKIEGGKRIIVVLSPDQAEAAKSVGGGNLSEGVRVALEKCKKVLT